MEKLDGLGGAGDVMSEGDSLDVDSGEDGMGREGGRKEDIRRRVSAIAHIAHISVDVYIRM